MFTLKFSQHGYTITETYSNLSQLAQSIAHNLTVGEYVIMLDGHHYLSVTINLDYDIILHNNSMMYHFDTLLSRINVWSMQNPSGLDYYYKQYSPTRAEVKLAQYNYGV